MYYGTLRRVDPYSKYDTLSYGFTERKLGQVYKKITYDIGGTMYNHPGM